MKDMAHTFQIAIWVYIGDMIWAPNNFGLNSEIV